jgi:N-acetyl-gamma-glutamyl-phosphate reductase
MKRPVKVTILGASGYTGIGLYRLCEAHPGVEIVAVSAERHAGKSLAEVFPQVSHAADVMLVPIDEAIEAGADVTFMCLPHGTTMNVVPRVIETGSTVIDLSADFRMDTPESYHRWYDLDHVAPEYLSTKVYGLAEFNRDAIAGAKLIAVPGCYPTSVQIGLAPLLKAGLIKPDVVIVDSKSGVSGAGRNPSQKTHFVETNENFRPYKVGREHRHVGEMEQELTRAAGTDTCVIFSPHLVPMNQGILSSMYVDLAGDYSTDDLLACLHQAYDAERCIRVTDHLPETAFVRDTNYVDVSARVIEGTGKAAVFCAIDNLVKGAYGQALQCMNIACGFDEYEGLPL